MKKTVKILVVLMCIALMASAFMACTQTAPTEDTSAEQETASEEEVVEQEVASEDPAEDGEESAPKRIFFTNAYFTAPYCAPMTAAAEAEAAAQGAEITIADGKGDAQVQLDQIKTAIAEKYDGILYFPADQASSVNIVKTLVDSGIPFIVINSKVDPSVMDLIGTYVGPDVYNQGVVVSGMVKEILPDGGNVVIIEGAGGTDAQINRTQGFLDGIADTPGIVVLDQQKADWDPAKALTVTEDFLTKYGDQIDVIYTHDDGMFQGAYKAAQDAGVADSIMFVSIGANRAGIEAVKAGQLYGTASQSPILEGKDGVAAILKLIAGETLPKELPTESLPVTLSNVEEFGDAGW